MPVHRAIGSAAFRADVVAIDAVLLVHEDEGGAMLRQLRLRVLAVADDDHLVAGMHQPGGGPQAGGGDDGGVVGSVEGAGEFGETHVGQEAGEVNGEGRVVVLLAAGWWEQPAAGPRSPGTPDVGPEEAT